MSDDVDGRLIAAVNQCTSAIKPTFQEALDRYKLPEEGIITETLVMDVCAGNTLRMLGMILAATKLGADELKTHLLMEQEHNSLQLTVVFDDPAVQCTPPWVQVTQAMLDDQFGNCIRLAAQALLNVPDDSKRHNRALELVHSMTNDILAAGWAAHRQAFLNKVQEN